MKYLFFIMSLLSLKTYSQEIQSETVIDLSNDVLSIFLTEVLGQYKPNDTALRRDTIYSRIFPREEIFDNTYLYYRAKAGDPYILFIDSLGKIRQINYTNANYSCHYYVFYLEKYPNYVFLYPLFSRKNYTSRSTQGILVLDKGKYASYFIGYNKSFIYDKFLGILRLKSINDFQVNDLFILDTFMRPKSGYRFYNKMVVTYSEYSYDGYEITEQFYLLKPDYNLLLDNLTLLKLGLIDKTGIKFYFKGSVDIKSHLQYPFWMLYPHYNFD